MRFGTFTEELCVWYHLNPLNVDPVPFHKLCVKKQKQKQKTPYVVFNSQIRNKFSNQ